ncbi:protein translocase subunit SecD [Streptomyces sp. AJS327]|uniref:protein translocase subunit SecD n=1 Tax=Streptomyces sp. AJS327 TaxID=2545265 RepID=UPI0015DF97D5|nr:protein translocase subunit SecD [Streptomyces sp. AJS327]MBA0050795.1 protein translocase subunit SecD [Streptomyces sp. AJS327]
MAAPKRGRRSPGGQGRPWRSLTLILLVMLGLTGGMFASGETTPRLGIDLAGGTSITLEAKNQPGKPNAINQSNMDTAVSIIERRVNGLGVQEAEVQTQGDKHIVVNIPKGTDSAQAREQVGTTAHLGFRPVLTGVPATAQPKPKPSPSSSAGSKGEKSGENGDRGDQDGESGQRGDKSSGDEGEEDGEPEVQPSPQGHRGDQALATAADDEPTPKGSEKPKEPTPTAPPQQQPPQPPGLPGKLGKKLEAADCSSAEARSKVAREAANTKDKEPVVACDEEQGYKYALGPVAVEGKNVKDAEGVLDDKGQWIVQMSFDGTGSDKFAKITGDISRKAPPQNQFAIVLDGEIVSAPSVRQQLSNNAQIEGNFTQESAEELGNILSYGALPLTFEESDVTTVTPALGSEQLKAGLISGAIGLALVIIYMVAYYRGLALIAIASLIVSGILTYTIMTLLGPGIGFALNLPAVCGAIVAIGITADSFIVYFERIRDEVREGRSLQPAMARAWPRARRTILVSDFVSFLAAAVLFVVTVGKVQGFAFTLGLTTALDVVVVFFFTRPVMTLLARKTFFAKGHSWSGLDPRRLGAQPPLRRRRPSAVSSEPKEA